MLTNTYSESPSLKNNFVTGQKQHQLEGIFDEYSVLDENNYSKSVNSANPWSYILNYSSNQYRNNTLKNNFNTNQKRDKNQLDSKIKLMVLISFLISLIRMIMKLL